ncbi:hypothetical protein ACGC1H_005341 [Rhizoctonia solani]
MTVMQQWEEAGLTLSSALQKYLSACITLTTIVPTSAADTNMQDLAYLIDTALSPQGLHVTLAQRLLRSRSILAQARNRMFASPLYHLPEDILVNVFTNVIYSQRRNAAVYMGQKIKSIYKRLHALLGVCSIWRQTTLNHSKLWFLVPVIHGNPGFSVHRATSLSLQRAPGANLHLGAILSQKSHTEAIDIKDVATQIFRFHAINIVTESDSTLHEIFGQLLSASVPKLSELSLCLDYESEPSTDLATSLEQRFLFKSAYTYLPQFTKLFESVTVMRLSGAGTYWDQVTFSNRLVEVRLEDFVLGYEPDLAVLLATLVSASELQYLSLISITTFSNSIPEVLGDLGEDFVAILPKLRVLHLEDLYFNTLRDVTKSIAQGSHDLTLFLTPKSLLVAAPIESRFQNIPLNAVCEVVSRVRVNTLMLSAKHEWLNNRELEMILRSTPSLKTLKMERWRFHGPVYQALTRPHSFYHAFPRIESLLFTLATIHDPQKFIDMISSHSGSIQRLALGVAFYSKATQPYISYRALAHQLESQVPSFQLVPGSYTPQEFESRIWQLW